MFFFNWRRLNPEQAYPGYEVIQPQFLKYFRRYVEFLDSHNVALSGQQSHELTYVNIIPRGKGWETLYDIGNILPDLSWRSDARQHLPSPKGLAWQCIFDVSMSCSGKSDLFVNLQTAQTTPEGAPILRLEFTVRRADAASEEVEMVAWFDKAHEIISETFLNFTGKDTQNTYWKMT